MLWGFAHKKAERKMLMKLTPGGEKQDCQHFQM